MNRPVTSSGLVACLCAWALGGASPAPAAQESAPGRFHGTSACGAVVLWTK